jgi:small subunit ribosomal protein S21
MQVRFRQRRGMHIKTLWMCFSKAINSIKYNNNKTTKNKTMIVVQLKEGENIERALKKFKRKYEKTGVVKELRRRQAFQKPSVVNRKARQHAVYVQQLHQAED